MEDLWSLVAGYIAGLIVGSLLLIFAIAWFYYTQPETTPPDWYFNIEHEFQLLYDKAPTIFTIGFVFGFLSGLGGSGSAANKAKDKNSS